MSLIFIPRSGEAGDVVQLLEAALLRADNSGTVYSGLKFDDDGNLYARQSGGGWSSLGAWLLNGTAGDFTLIRSIDSGTLTTDAGASVVLGTDRIFDVQVSAPGSKQAEVTFDIELTTDPGVSLANRTYLFDAVRL